MSIGRLKRKPAVIIFIRAARVRGKVQIMSEEQKRIISGSFVVCDVQEEYIEHLFKILSERMSEYQFHLFHDPDRMMEFIEKSGADILLIGDEYRGKIRDSPGIRRVFLLTENREGSPENGVIPVFRYQSASQIISEIMGGIRDGTSERKIRKEFRSRSSGCIREEIKTRGMIGIYSPVHRIGKTRFAMGLGQKLSEKVPVLYLNLEGYSGGGYYLPEKTEYDLGDIIYCMKQERQDYGLKISSMTGQSGSMDYIMPMKNETDLRAVRGEEWIKLFGNILEKCIYEVLILDLGDCIDGLYDILRNCSRIYTPYIPESAAMAKLAQYEMNLRTAGYGDVLMHTVKKQMQRKRCAGERTEAG